MNVGAQAQHPPLIGITGRQGNGAVIGAPRGFADAPVDIYLREYAQSVAAAGGLAVHIPLETDALAIARHLDGLIIAGGEDVDPQRYGQERGPFTHVVDPVRDALEVALLEAAIARGVPVLGICRGQQLINVAYGGTLVQHLEAGDASSHMNAAAARSDRLHDVDLTPGTVAHRLYGDRARVNTFHHQAVDRLGDGLVVAGRASDGTIEAIELAGAPVIAVQWHPECFGGDPVFDWLVDRSRGDAPAIAAAHDHFSTAITTNEQELADVTAA